MDTVVSSPKTDVFRFRINPEVRECVESIYAKNGLTFTQAINIFIQQSINAGGFPFEINESNSETIKAKSLKRLMNEIDIGINSGEPIEEHDVYKLLGVEHT